MYLYVTFYNMRNHAANSYLLKYTLIFLFSISFLNHGSLLKYNKIFNMHILRAKLKSLSGST